MKTTPYYIAISGIMGSGKTTLVKGLSREFGWVSVPQKKLANRYLTDLFKDMERWAFEAQLDFLTSKSFEIIELIQKNKNLILDRSIYEDYLVFAKHFYNKNKIDDRSYTTYCEIAKYFLSTINQPDLIIHCTCSTSTAKKRIFQSRKVRDYESLYPENHIEEINSLYERIYTDFNDCPLYYIDSEIYDFRSNETIKGIAKELMLLFNYSSQNQLSLFDDKHNSFEHTFLKEIIPITNANSEKSIIEIDVNNKDVPSYPYAYIAGPFTSKAVDEKSSAKTVSKTNGLFQSPPLHGIISSNSSFRKMLLALEKKLSGLGISAIIPHRDVSKWGKLYVPPIDVFDNCTKHVSNCALFIGILGESNGSHYEFGLAYALEKPIILIRCKEIRESYISQGILEASSKVMIFNCDRVRDIPAIFSSSDFLKFITTIQT